jgi:hypothetical protein
MLETDGRLSGRLSFLPNTRAREGFCGTIKKTAGARAVLMASVTRLNP